MYTFGSDYWGCIGCNNELDEEVTTPYRVEFFAENPVSQVACGECHIVALTGGFTRVCKKSVVPPASKCCGFFSLFKRSHKLAV